jgi:magnesium transporter
VGTTKEPAVLTAYYHDATRLVERPLASDGPVAGLVWIDLLRPTAEEDARVEALLGITIPALAEVEEIELSSRLYHEDGAEFMTMAGLIGLDTDEPAKTLITFILKDATLVTVRYAEPKPFLAYLARAQKPGNIVCASGEQVMLGLAEAMGDRMADALEVVGSQIDHVSRAVFRKKSTTAKRFQHDLRTIVEQIGIKAEVLTMVQESLVSVSRMMSFHAPTSATSDGPDRDTREFIEVIQRDAVALGEHARTLTAKIEFLLNATLGLINLEQNQIIKIFSVVAFVFLPPTLVASIYGMNFDFMPELNWPFGYPMALGLMVISAIAPYLYFRGRGWL